MDRKEVQLKMAMGGYLQQTLSDGKLDMMLKRHSFPFLKYTVNGSLCMQNNSLYKKNYLVFRQKE